MGGWVSLIGDVSDFNSRLNKFRSIFSVEGVPELHLEVHKDRANLRTVCWAWNKDYIPDVYFKTKNEQVIVLCGVITDLGGFGPLPYEQDDATKKVLELWNEHGEKVIKNINGSFSCLLHDSRKNKTLIYTDRFASRSVWITEEDGSWIIGNFPSAISAIKKYTPKIDPVGLWSLFHTGRHIGIHGLYSGINSLMAGEKAVLSQGVKKISKWWERRYQPVNGLSPSEWGNRLAKALVSSANRYNKICKNPYLFLSGGLDSRIVAAVYKKPLKTLTLCTQPNIESRIASFVSKSLGLEHQTIIRSPYWYLDTMSASALVSSGNYLNHHTHFIVPVKNIVSENQGAEFLLGDLLENFNKHYFSIPDNQNLSFNLDKIHEIFNYVPSTIKDVNRIGIHFNRDIRKTLEEQYYVALKEYAKSILNVSEDGADRFDTFLRWADVSTTYTYNMITCMWPLAKERNIYFDNELDDLSLKIPASLRAKGILHKWILFNLCKKLLLIPDANNFLPPIVPKQLQQFSKKIRPKLGSFRRNLIRKGNNKPVTTTSGSWLLLHEMYRKDQCYKKYIENIITDENIFSSDIFDLEQIQKTWKEYLAGNISLHNEIEALKSFGCLNKLILFDGI